MLLFISLLNLSCDPVHENTQSIDDDLHEKIKSEEPITFDQDILPIFVQRCISCHDDFDSYLDASSYSDVKSKIRKILKTVVETKTMPSDAQNMPQIERDLVEKWINDGALKSLTAPHPLIK